MVDSEQIIERTLYVSLLRTLLRQGLTLNPENYLPVSAENERRFEQDRRGISKFVYLFGIGNNFVRGAKDVPRITLELNAYFPGDIGTPEWDINGNTEEDPYQAVEYDWETKDIAIDVHIVANTQRDIRMLHNVLYRSLPPRAYLVPYTNNDFEDWRTKKVGPTDNIFIELSNYYDHPDVEHGLLEKVYTYTCKDSMLWEHPHPEISFAPIQDISLLIHPEDVLIEDGVKLILPD